jgi:hypothetical protein
MVADEALDECRNLAPDTRVIAYVGASDGRLERRAIDYPRKAARPEAQCLVVGVDNVLEGDAVMPTAYFSASRRSASSNRPVVLSIAVEERLVVKRPDVVSR